MIQFLQSNIQPKKKYLLALLILVCIALWAMQALSHPGYYTSHDGWHQVARLFHFDQSIRDYQFPPRWSGLLYGGFGYPIFIFSYHLPWFIAEPFVLAGFSIFDAIKITFVLTYIASGLTMFLWINELWGKRAGFISAAIYLLTPYRLANVLVRANIGEAVSYFCVPLIFWAFFRLHKRFEFSAVIIGALGIAGLLLSHIMIVFLLLFFGIAYVSVLFIKSTQRFKFGIAVLGTLFLGVGSAAYYLFPAIIYKPQTIFQDQYHGLYRNYFTPLSKLLYSPWGYGALGTAGEMSRQVGLVIWGVALSALLLTIINSIKKNSKSKNTFVKIIVAICLTSFGLAIYMMVKESLPVWKLFESQTFIDFPWRFLSITTLTGSILAGSIVYQLKGKFQLIAICILLLLGFYTNRNHIRVNQYTDIPLSLYIDSELSTNTDDEYLPKWVNRQYAKEKQELVKINQGISSELKQTTATIKFAYSAPVPTTAEIHHMYFPGWTAQLDQKELTVNKNNNGGMNLSLPSGEHQVELTYKPTMIMRIGELVTVISVFVLVLSLFLQKSYKGKISV